MRVLVYSTGMVRNELTGLKVDIAKCNFCFFGGGGLFVCGLSVLCFSVTHFKLWHRVCSGVHLTVTSKVAHVIKVIILLQFPTKPYSSINYPKFDQ